MLFQLQYLYQVFWPAHPSFFLHKCTVLFFHYTPTPDLRLCTIQFAPPCLSLFHFGGSVFNQPPQSTTHIFVQYCFEILVFMTVFAYCHWSSHSDGCIIMNEFIALCNTMNHLFISVLQFKGWNSGMLLRETAGKCVWTDALINIEIFLSASCLSTTAEDTTTSTGPPPTLDVLQPAPGTVSPSVPG